AHESQGYGVQDHGEDQDHDGDLDRDVHVQARESLNCGGLDHGYGVRGEDQGQDVHVQARESLNCGGLVRDEDLDRGGDQGDHVLVREFLGYGGQDHGEDRGEGQGDRE
ncbi:hypothetical protein LPJ62_006110, partial [Coemansia sp. RSA 2167]